MVFDEESDDIAKLSLLKMPFGHKLCEFKNAQIIIRKIQNSQRIVWTRPNGSNPMEEKGESGSHSVTNETFFINNNLKIGIFERAWRTNGSNPNTIVKSSWAPLCDHSHLAIGERQRVSRRKSVL